MTQSFAPGDYLMFQLESGYGLIRILAVEGDGPTTIWHVSVYEELFPDVEQAEAALIESGSLHAGKQHFALTDRALERTPAAKLGNASLTVADLEPYVTWQGRPDHAVHDRSLLLLLGMR